MNENTSPTDSTEEREFVISRVFDAPRELVYKMWTEPAHVAQWWGPHEFTNPVCELDVRPGGTYRIVMRGPDGKDYPVTGVYREVVAPERLVMTDDCSEHPDEWHDAVDPDRDKSAGNPSLESLSTVTFEEVSGKTTVTIRTLFPTSEVRAAMLRMGMNEGWSQSLERLAAELAKR